jgi:geranylgeranyl pyrophosphate synthase
MTIEGIFRKLDLVLSQTSELIMVRLQKSIRDCFEGPLFENLRESLVDEWDSAVPVRGYLVRVGYEVGGGKFGRVTDVATAIELAQLATLILDDVIDRSDIRTGFSTYRTYGEGVSLVVSEMLKSAANKTLAETLSRNPQFANRFAVLERFERMYARVCLGQVLDLMYERSTWISEAQYLRMVSCGTAGFLEEAARIGCLLSGAPEFATTAMCRYARSLGFALQIYDDVLDLNSTTSGLKTFAGDLKRRKQRLPLIHFIRNSAKNEREKFCAILKKRKITDRDALRMTRSLKRNGSVEYALRRASHFLTRAIQEVPKFASGSRRDLLIGLAELIRPDVV